MNHKETLRHGIGEHSRSPWGGKGECSSMEVAVESGGSRDYWRGRTVSVIAGRVPKSVLNRTKRRGLLTRVTSAPVGCAMGPIKEWRCGAVLISLSARTPLRPKQSGLDKKPSSMGEEKTRSTKGGCTRPEKRRGISWTKTDRGMLRRLGPF